MNPTIRPPVPLSRAVALIYRATRQAEAQGVLAHEHYLAAQLVLDRELGKLIQQSVHHGR